MDVDKPVVTLTKTTNSNGTVTITISSSDTSGTDTKIYFTTDGSTPTSNSTQYSEELTFAVSASVKAIAIDSA